VPTDDERETHEGDRSSTCGKQKQRRREGESDKGGGDGVRMVRRLLLLRIRMTKKLTTTAHAEMIATRLGDEEELS
jgi:hypothetical protein